MLTHVRRARSFFTDLRTPALLEASRVCNNDHDGTCEAAPAQARSNGGLIASGAATTRRATAAAMAILPS